MNIKEYKEMILGDIRVEANGNVSDPTSEFIKYVAELLETAEEFENFTESYFEITGNKNRKMQIDGFAFDEVDKSCILAIADFTNQDEVMSITNSEIDRLYGRLEAYVNHSLNGFIRLKCEESSEGYGFARIIEDKIDKITKFKFYILTDKVLSDRVKAIKTKPIEGKRVEVYVWDLNRFYNLVKSKMQKEEIEIDFTDYMDEGLPSILAVDCKEEQYKSYLTAVPGNVLADLYIEYGSRLLEGNVRSFLSIRGKVNKQIRSTILNKPEMFFAYNNGIAATATAVEYSITEKGLVINKLKDLQIINGGQTTASIANAVLQDKKDVSNIMVPMKLSVVNNEKAEEIIPVISRCANSQNKVDEADFFSNHPYHIRMEEYSRKIFAPAVDGKQYQTIWFYERARGQHTQEQMKLSLTERKKYLLKNPKNQVMKKVDIAKYINTYDGHPDVVSRGAQYSMREFAIRIDKEWNKSDAFFNEYYYKKTIALGIVFKETEKLVSNLEWYKQVKAYRANVVTYSLAILFDYIRDNVPTMTFDFKRIWNNQKMYAELINQLEILTEEVYNFITDKERVTQNVTEWCKKDVCWTRAKAKKWTITSNFLSTLIPKEIEKSEIKEEISNRKIENELNVEVEVIKLGSKYWSDILNWGVKRSILSPMEQSLLRSAATMESAGKLPSSKQCTTLLKIKDKAYDEGYSA